MYRAGAAVVSTVTSLFSFTLTAGSSEVDLSLCVFRLPVTGSREIRNLVFFLGFFLKTPGVYFSTCFLLLFLGLEHDILFPVGAASEQLSHQIHDIRQFTGDKYCVVLLIRLWPLYSFELRQR